MAITADHQRRLNAGKSMVHAGHIDGYIADGSRGSIDEQISPRRTDDIEFSGLQEDRGDGGGDATRTNDIGDAHGRNEVGIGSNPGNRRRRLVRRDARGGSIHRQGNSGSGGGGGVSSPSQHGLAGDSIDMVTETSPHEPEVASQGGPCIAEDQSVRAGRQHAVPRLALGAVTGAGRDTLPPITGEGGVKHGTATRPRVSRSSSRLDGGMHQSSIPTTAMGTT